MIVHFVDTPVASPVVHVVPPTAVVVVAAVRLCATLPVDVPDAIADVDIDPTCPGSVPVFSVRTDVNDTSPAGIVVGDTFVPHMANSTRTPPTAVGVAVGDADEVPDMLKPLPYPRMAVPVAGTLRYTTAMALVRFAVDVAIAIVAVASVDATQFCL
jgi:hypothetical protein